MKAIHIEAKKEDVSNVVLMPGDPLRAKYIAENFLTDVKEINRIRNMLGYTGYYKGKRVTVMGSGMGIPSIGIYSYELFSFYDVDKIIRIGTAGSLDKSIKLRDVVLAEKSYSPSSFAYVYSKVTDNVLYSSKELNNTIKEKADELNINIKKGSIITSDVFTVYANIDHIIEKIPKHIKPLACEMEAFGLFHIANVCGKEATCLISIVDSPFEDIQITSEEREKELNNMITLALESI